MATKHDQLTRPILEDFHLTKLQKQNGQSIPDSALPSAPAIYVFGEE